MGQTVLETHTFTTDQILLRLLRTSAPDTYDVKLKTKQGVLTVQLLEPKLKGGALSRRAAMLCNDQLFRTWLSAADPNDAREMVLEECGVSSRSLIDHDDSAAAAFRALDSRYTAWANPE